jgi:hypothetical protein
MVVVQLSITVAGIAAATRASVTIMSDELKLIVRIQIPGPARRDLWVLVEFPARHAVGRRNRMFAVGARSGLVAVRAGSDNDVGDGAEEEVGVDATGRTLIRQKVSAGGKKHAAVCNIIYMHPSLDQVVGEKERKKERGKRAEQLTYKSTINGMVLYAYSRPSHWPKCFEYSAMVIHLKKQLSRKGIVRESK